MSINDRTGSCKSKKRFQVMKVPVTVQENAVETPPVSCTVASQERKFQRRRHASNKEDHLNPRRLLQIRTISILQPNCFRGSTASQFGGRLHTKLFQNIYFGLVRLEIYDLVLWIFQHLSKREVGPLDYLKL